MCPERVEEITKNTFTFDGGGYWNLLALRPLGATKENFLDFWDKYILEHPLEDRHARDAQNSHRLFNEEIARWSPTRST